MTYKNANGTLTDMSSIAESKDSGDMSDSNDVLGENRIDEADTESDTVQNLQSVDTSDYCSAPLPSDESGNERAEYERLIRTRFKEFYTDDTQKMINKRFKRYKAMEQRLCELEEKEREMSKREAELNEALAAERARTENETEQRVVAQMLASHRRPSENGYSPRRAPAPFDVSSLTKSQRADIAKRAFGGEKISF